MCPWYVVDVSRWKNLTCLVGLVMCPWNLLSSSNQFTNYLSSYSVFLSSIAGCIVCDYYWVRKGYLRVSELYDADSAGPYYFTLGFNWRGYAAYIAGILINVVGFAGAVGQTVPIAATYIYNLNYFGGFIVASATYYALCRFFPIPATSETWLEAGNDYFDAEEVPDTRDSGSGIQDTEAYPSKSAEGYPSKSAESA
jgi:nucleobase:cation symporter-1, NCS1 family